ncbi:MAG: DKNYY domain-containing protein [Patescibacteria group bacterium]
MKQKTRWILIVLIVAAGFTGTCLYLSDKGESAEVGNEVVKSMVAEFDSEGNIYYYPQGGDERQKSYTYASDGTQVFMYTDQTLSAKRPIAVDVTTFVPLHETFGGAYAKDKNHVYWMDTILPGVDAASVVVPAVEYIDTEEKNNYFSDKNHLYRLDGVYRYDGNPKNAKNLFTIVR